MRPDYVADVGNSRVKVGRVRPGGLPEVLVRDAEFTPAAWPVLAGAAWAVAGVHPGRVRELAAFLTRRGDRVEVVARESVAVTLNGPDPAQVGLDRLLDCLAANHLRTPGRPAIVADAGTAFVVNALNAAGELVGGAIAPGLATLAKSLHAHTAALPLISPTELSGPLAPVRAVTTADAIRAGCQRGFVGLARELIAATRDALGSGAELFLTGGDAGWLAEHLGFEGVRVVPELTLFGVHLAAGGMP